MSGSSLLFAITAAFSIYGVSYYRKNGSLPDYMDTSDKFNGLENMQPNHSDEGETQMPHTNAEEQTHPSGPITWNLQQPPLAPAELGFEPVDTSYHSGVHLYEPVQRPQSRPAFQYAANNSQYDTHPSNESQFVGGLEPLPLPIGGRPSRHNLAMDYDHGGYASAGRVNFPEADYGR